MPDGREKKCKILIVDDVPKNIQVVANILQTRGYSMAFAQNGETALELTRANPFDLILLDIMMPGMDGFEVCRRIRENPETASVPVLFLTAKTDTESIVNGFASGAMDYVIKPVNEAELLARVKTHLELYRASREMREMNLRLREEIRERTQAEQRFRSMYENAVQGMFRSTADGRILSINPAYVRILGYEDREEMMGIEDMGQTVYDQPEDREKMLSNLRAQGVITDYEIKIRRKDGSTAWIMMNARLARDEKDREIIEGIVIDNTARKKAEEKLRLSRERFRHEATHDNLTGLYNTRHLYRALEKLITESREKQTPFSLIFMDVDNFKRVVDYYGHLKGSQTLREMAATIRESLTEPAFAVAYGGDEFVVVLPDTDKETALSKAENIRVAIRETSYLSSYGHDVHIRASMGIATFPDDADDLNGLLALADQAMFHVKGEGKDAVRASARPETETK
ncbi:MAG: diguanylate cyclase [Desulfococcaceae bacterium]